MIIKMNHKWLFMCLSHILSMRLSSLEAHTMKDVDQLLKDKLSTYNRLLRPKFNQTETLDIQFSFELLSIKELNEVSETFTVTGILILNWTDEMMSWDPKDYGNLTQFIMESAGFWTPNIILTNNAESMKKVGGDWQAIRYQSNGMALYVPGDVFSSTCSVDVTYYPWDTQRCELIFAAWAYYGDELQIVPNQNQVSRTFYTENGAWNFIKSSIRSYGSVISITIVMERKPAFVVINVMVPMLFMSFLNILVFLIPTESGERMSYCITVLLSIAVFLTLVGSNLPKSSSHMSTYSFYLVSILAISILITLANIFSLVISFLDDSISMPSCLVTMSRCLKCQCRQTKTEQAKRSKMRLSRDNFDCHVSRDLNTNSTVTRGSCLPAPNALDVDANQICNDKRRLKQPPHSLPEVQRIECEITWKQLSAVLDRVLCVVFFLAVMIDTMAFFLMMKSGPVDEYTNYINPINIGFLNLNQHGFTV